MCGWLLYTYYVYSIIQWAMCTFSELRDKVQQIFSVFMVQCAIMYMYTYTVA